MSRFETAGASCRAPRAGWKDVRCSVFDARSAGSESEIDHRASRIPARPRRGAWAAAALLALFALPSCGSRGAPPPSAGPGDFSDALDTARMLREVGLPDAALSECRFVIERAGPACSIELSDALDLAGDCELDRGNLEKAIGHYREAGDRRVNGSRSSRKIASAYLRVGRWNDALAVLEAVRASGIPWDRQENEALLAKVRPITALDRVWVKDFGGRGDPGVRAAGTFEDWIVPDPFHFECEEGGEEHGRIRILFQKGMRGLFHPLAWKGESFRLTLRFRIDAVDRREQMIRGGLGIGSEKMLRLAQDSPGAHDGLLVWIFSNTMIQGEIRARHLSLERLKLEGAGLAPQARTATLTGDAALDVWFRTVIEYSRELGSARVRVYRPQTLAEDSLVSDQMLHEVPPFGDGPFFLLLGGAVEGGDQEHTMEVSVDYIRFETSSEAPLPDLDRFRPDDPVLRGNRRCFLRDWAGAIRDWEAAVAAEPGLGFVRFSIARALRKRGEVEKAAEAEAALLDRARELKPSDVDQIGLLSKFDAEAESFLARLQKARNE